jgi:CysZ protein
MSDFFRGLSAPLRAAKLLAANARLRKLAMMPLLVNILLFAVGIPIIIWLVTAFTEDILGGESSIQVGLRVALQIVLSIMVIVASFYLFAIIGNIVAAPFNSALSEAIEEHLTGRPLVNQVGVVQGAMRGILTGIGRLFLFILLYPPIFLTQLIPVAGFIIHPILAVLYGAFVLSLDFTDPTFERHLDTFRQKAGYIWRRKPLYLGFGLTAVAMAIVPIINFLLLPLCVTAAAMIYLEKDEG